MDYDATIGQNGYLYVPQAVREALGNDIKMLATRGAVLLVPANLSTETQLKYLRIVERDLKLQMEIGDGVVTT